MNYDYIQEHQVNEVDLVSAEQVKIEGAEMDEMWSFVQDRSQQYQLWWAIDHQTGVPPAYCSGTREHRNLDELWTLLAPFHIKTVYADGNYAYKNRITEGGVLYELNYDERSGKLNEKGRGEELATIKVKCPYCGSDQVVRYGRNSRTGRERFLCNNPECVRKTFQLEYKNNACKPGMREKIVEMVMNGSGMRDTGRVSGVSKDTVTKVLKKRKNSQSQSTGRT